jgi:hypothetical protein
MRRGVRKRRVEAAGKQDVGAVTASARRQCESYQGGKKEQPGAASRTLHGPVSILRKGEGWGAFVAAVAEHPPPKRGPKRD